MLGGGRYISKTLVLGKLAEEKMFFKIGDVKFEFTEVEQKTSNKTKKLYFPGVKITLVRP